MPTVIISFSPSPSKSVVKATHYISERSSIDDADIWAASLNSSFNFSLVSLSLTRTGPCIENSSKAKEFCSPSNSIFALPSTVKLFVNF